MRCGRCNAELIAGDAFCRACGAPIGTPAPSPEGASTRAPPPRRKRRGCLFLFGIPLLLLLIGAGLYVAVGLGWISRYQVARLAGRAPAEVSVVNITGGELRTTVTRMGVAEEERRSDAVVLAPYETGGVSSVLEGEYRIEFRRQGQSEPWHTCTANVRRGDVWRFVAIPEGIAVQRGDTPATGPTELRVETSSLCRGGS